MEVIDDLNSEDAMLTFEMELFGMIGKTCKLKERLEYSTPVPYPNPKTFATRALKVPLKASCDSRKSLKTMHGTKT